MQFHAGGLFADKSVKEITARVRWESSDAAILAIDAGGLATVGNRGGTVTITATDLASATRGVAIGGTATVTVTEPLVQSVLISPHADTIDLGESKQFTATFAYSDGQKLEMTRERAVYVEWLCAGALEHKGSGLVLATQAGAAKLTAKEAHGASASVDLTVVGVRSMDAVFGDFSYHVTAEKEVKPLLMQAVSMFRVAEGLNQAMFDADRGFADAEQLLVPVETALKEINQFTSFDLKGAAGSATTAQVADGDTKDLLVALQAALDGTQDEVDDALVDIENAHDEHLKLMYEEFAEKMKHDIRTIVDLGKVAFGAASAAHGEPTELATAMLDLMGGIAEANVGWDEDARKLGYDISDRTLQNAETKLAKVRERLKKLAPSVESTTERVKSAANNKDNMLVVAEGKYDPIAAAKGGRFQFKLLRSAIGAAEAEIAAAIKAKDAAHHADNAAHAFASIKLKPEEWMADVAADRKILQELSEQANDMYVDAIGRQNSVGARLKSLRGDYVRAMQELADAPVKAAR